LADLRRTSFRLGLGLALAVVGLFEILSLLHGVRSVRRLRARVAHDAEERVLLARPGLDAALAGGGEPAWEIAASFALSRGLATEVDVLDSAGRVVFSRPATAPVAHDLRPDERQRLGAGRTRSLVAQQGDEVRAFVYIALPRGGRGASFRMASPAPDLEQELSERQQVFAGHLASLAALAVAAALVLLPREGERSAPPVAALHAYEQAMEQLRDQGEEMSARHDAEKRRMEEAIREKEALARAGELTAGIAHEVRNGLGTIVGYARLLERASLPEDPAAAARAIREECETLETVVRRFTDFVRLERLQLGDTDLSRLLARVVAREQRAREEVRTRLVGLDAPLVVRADEELLERAFENVVRNAVEAAAGGGRHVELSARESAGQVEIRVEDDGPGLATDHPGEIRPFYTTRPGGLGLGLPLARKIVLLHGGSLDLAGREAGGARVLVRLPAAGPEF
jgi:signal transduction histidine kinase